MKKVRFALRMYTDDNIRSLKQLKNNFNLENVLEYYFSGKLLRWLKDREYIDEIKAVENLDENSPTFCQDLYKAFGLVPPTVLPEVDKGKIVKEIERKYIIRQYLNEHYLYSETEGVVLNNGELAELIKKWEDSQGNSPLMHINLLGTGDIFEIDPHDEIYKYCEVLGVNNPLVKYVNIRLDEEPKIKIKRVQFVEDTDKAQIENKLNDDKKMGHIAKLFRFLTNFKN